MSSLIKMSFRILLRNKGFLFFLLAIPVLSAFLLGLKTESKIYHAKEEGKIIELENCKERAVYRADTASFVVKVYDAAETELSDYLLEQLGHSGMYTICRADVRGMKDEEVQKQAEKDAFEDRVGILLYLKKDFGEALKTEEWEKGLKLFRVSEDERQELFESDMESLLGQLSQVYAGNEGDAKATISFFEKMDEQMPEKRVEEIAKDDAVVLSDEQADEKAMIGYAYAIMTLGFMFCGVLVAHTVIEEKNNKVFTRIMLSKTGTGVYFTSKVIVTLLISLMQTLVAGISMTFLVRTDFGIPFVDFLFAIFLMGIIFSTLSLLLGILLGDVMSSNYAAFAVWCSSALLSGLYFPMDETTDTMNAISYLMPQRWFMDATDLLFVGDKHGYFMLLYVTIAYVTVILSIGCVGIRIRKQEA